MRHPAAGEPVKVVMRVIEVKGRAARAKTVTITSNEIRTALNKPDDFILAVVEVDGDRAAPMYLHRPFQQAPDIGVTSVNYDLGSPLATSDNPNRFVLKRVSGRCGAVSRQNF